MNQTTQTAADLKNVVAGAIIEVDAVGLKRHRQLSVTSVQRNPDGVSIFTTSGHTRGSNVAGGHISANRWGFVYQATLLQQVREVESFRIVRMPVEA